ncbi:hypothetical protein DBZ47_25735 (plasmid) [Escherichia coli]|nr:hypothetical protein DBZ47_25735 [Escherichia coli]PUD90623.1 hypothetical protein DBX29_25515 [Escherichia coli]
MSGNIGANPVVTKPPEDREVAKNMASDTFSCRIRLSAGFFSVSVCSRHYPNSPKCSVLEAPLSIE